MEAFVKYSLFLHCCSALRKHLIPCINAAQVPLVDKEARLVCIRGWSKGVHVYACPVFVYAWKVVCKTQARKTNAGCCRPQGQTAKQRYFINGNASCLSLFVQSSLLLQLSLFSFPPSIPLGNSSLIKKMGLTPNKPFCLSV